jgi:hypothetical protein
MTHTSLDARSLALRKHSGFPQSTTPVGQSDGWMQVAPVVERQTPGHFWRVRFGGLEVVPPISFAPGMTSKSFGIKNGRRLPMAD